MPSRSKSCETPVSPQADARADISRSRPTDRGDTFILPADIRSATDTAKTVSVAQKPASAHFRRVTELAHPN
jgi:hypothetical protein